ncbi:hypothetical protein [Prolixibacter sp. NT017]|uniref:hypothetical protein n=1 Tax=Prolixibacter sp. NT017 TaxID=2652390 RepID=UPI001285C495|nr:hypothetical protein [Prolixibacter sp. NT017]GET25516.1 hypothetical protein NT017_18450 [Prolixibacter sp. NT017]
MNETWFNIAEAAVSPSNILGTFLITLISSAIIGGIFYRSIRKATRDAVLGFLISEIILLFILFSVKDEVKSERLKFINESMLSIDPNSFKCEYTDVYISNWKTGMKCILKCPKEIGYYIKTCEMLEKENDIESAATLIELGMDFIKISPPPTQLCEKLQRYYDKLPDRPKLNKDCIKIHY